MMIKRKSSEQNSGKKTIVCYENLPKSYLITIPNVNNKAISLILLQERLASKK